MVLEILNGEPKAEILGNGNDGADNLVEAKGFLDNVFTVSSISRFFMY
jgi:hypothetical protein